MSETSQAGGPGRGAGHGAQAHGAPRSRRGTALAVSAVVAVAAALVVLVQREQRRPSLVEPDLAPTPGRPTGVAAVTPPAPGPDAGPAASAPTDERAQWQARLLHAETRLENYKLWAKYPPGSRPASEQPDRMFPTAPVLRTLPLARRGVPNPHVRVRLQQDRLSLVGQESARLSLRCEDDQGALLPCTVVSARVEAVVRSGDSGSPPPGFTPIQFADDGRAGDEKAGDGTFTATVQPGRLGLRQRPGPLLVTCTLRLGSDEGEAMFDLFYTPEPPAVLTGKVREVVEQGSLSLYWGIEVRTAGRYVLAARVDDANGRPLALLEWNDTLEAGAHEVRLVLFGKLLRDLQPAMPLRVRDLDGFLLKEDADPDREYLPMLTGYHHTTSSYPLTTFSTDEWQSEQRDRNLQEYGRDVDEARQHVEGLPAPRP